VAVGQEGGAGGDREGLTEKFQKKTTRSHPECANWGKGLASATTKIHLSRKKKECVFRFGERTWVLNTTNDSIGGFEGGGALIQKLTIGLRELKGTREASAGGKLFKTTQHARRRTGLREGTGRLGGKRARSSLPTESRLRLVRLIS